jgi:hypothetical protein
MFKWLKKILGDNTTDTVSATVEVVAPVAIVESGQVSVESKPKRSRAKKADTTASTASAETAVVKRTAKSTPAKQSKKSQ